MKKRFIFLLVPILIFTGCGEDNSQPEPIIPPEPITNTYADYGAFLGRSENNVKDFEKYKYISIELDEFSQDKIDQINDKGTKIFAYLNVGSLETYRTYYNQFKSYTFMDYEDWPDERWIDVSKTEWQNFIVNTLAKSFKEKGAFGVYMDNVDVYSVCKENDLLTNSTITGLKNIIKGVNDLGLKVMVNGGAEFFDDMNDKNDNIFNSVYAYHQEEVFSLIEDYEENIFGKQEKEDQDYYLDITKIMKNKGKEVFYLEYTKDQQLIDKIDDYCSKNQIHYYISNNIDLN